MRHRSYTTKMLELTFTQRWSTFVQSIHFHRVNMLTFIMIDDDNRCFWRQHDIGLAEREKCFRHVQLVQKCQRVENLFVRGRRQFRRKNLVQLLGNVFRFNIQNHVLQGRRNVAVELLHIRIHFLEFFQNIGNGGGRRTFDSRERNATIRTFHIIRGRVLSLDAITFQNVANRQHLLADVENRFTSDDAMAVHQLRYLVGEGFAFTRLHRNQIVVFIVEQLQMVTFTQFEIKIQLFLTQLNILVHVQSNDERIILDIGHNTKINHICSVNLLSSKVEHRMRESADEFQVETVRLTAIHRLEYSTNWNRSIRGIVFRLLRMYSVSHLTINHRYHSYTKHN